MRKLSNYIPEETGRGLAQARVELTADDKKAAYLVIELGLLQQSLYAPKNLGERTLYPQEYSRLGVV